MREKTFCLNPLCCLLAALIAIVLLFTLNLSALAQSSANPTKIQAVFFNAQNHTIQLTTADDTPFAGDYQAVKLANPDRLLIDIPNTILATSVRVLPIRQDGIDRMELSQSVGSFYQGTRITLYGTSAQALNNTRIDARNSLMQVHLSGSPQLKQAQSVPPLPQVIAAASSGLNIIQSARFVDGALRLEGAPGATLSVKNQFTLTGPNRLVIDLANAALADRSLAQPMDIRAGPLQSIRLGQFDESTVRIVVETNRPNAFYLVYPNRDRQTLALANNLGNSVRTLPSDSQQMGVIQDINLTRRDNASVIKISTSDPMVRRIVRNQNDIEIDLVNIASNPSMVTYDKQQFSEIQEIRLTPLTPDQPNTRLVIKLNQPSVEMDSHVSLDGRVMEVVLAPKSYTALNYARRMPQVITPETSKTWTPPVKLRKGDFTVVVDAGHGGKDLGANRNGVYEKELNLSVAHKLKRALEARGVTVHMTRSTDTFLELSQITAITNRIKPDAFISVHTNASTGTAANGLETYYYTPQSVPLAKAVHKHAVNNINSPDRGVRKAMFYVIHHTQVPAVLFEMGYISHPSEREALQSDTRQNATAEALAQGVVEFLGRTLQAQAPLEEGALP